MYRAASTFPAGTSVATTNVADHVSNGVQRAIAELADGAGMAEVGYVIPPSVGVISGLKPDSGEPFINQIFLGFGAGAASPAADAWVTVGHVANAGAAHGIVNSFATFPTRHSLNSGYKIQIFTNRHVGI